ncbi:hypothetical protein [Roseomonas populi]|nr:hypothetical protein [Roseomonas pecuniae]
MDGAWRAGRSFDSRPIPVRRQGAADAAQAAVRLFLSGVAA